MSDQIKKGPWKAEEDEVLINHVKKYGPRDWSSIRSKGLLHRTGKSCRLRWVNKLRPNLKNGVKFSPEEERTVIELQAQLGNKWAKIATYLAGRTDNDVKNFWSSRQKRLTRILQTPASSSSSSNRSQRNKHIPVIHDDSPFEDSEFTYTSLASDGIETKNEKRMKIYSVAFDGRAPKFSSSSEEESLPKSQSSYIVKSQTMQMVPFPDLMHPNTLNYEQSFLPPEFDLIEKKPCTEALSQPPFPQIHNFQSEFTLPLENQEVVTRLGDPIYLEAFGNRNSSDLAAMQLPIMPTCFESERRAQIAGRNEIGNPVTPDSFVDDFPMDIFDHIEPLPSPLDW